MGDEVTYKGDMLERICHPILWLNHVTHAVLGDEVTYVYYLLIIIKNIYNNTYMWWRVTFVCHLVTSSPFLSYPHIFLGFTSLIAYCVGVHEEI